MQKLKKTVQNKMILRPSTSAADILLGSSARVKRLKIKLFGTGEQGKLWLVPAVQFSGPETPFQSILDHIINLYTCKHFFFLECLTNTVLKF